MINYQKVVKSSTGDIMNIDLPFMNQTKRKKVKITKQKLIKVQNEHTPIEVQNMTMPQLEYLYEHGSSTERELADHLIQARKKWALVELAMPMDAELASGSPFAGGVKF
jgi:broad specificity polyphosphatase/5'/3'-nucleotidase SurE